MRAATAMGRLVRRWGLVGLVVALLVGLMLGSGNASAPVAAAGAEATTCTISGGCVTTPLPPVPPSAAPRDLTPRVAATFTVNAVGEPASGTDATCTTPCTLRQAVNASNANDPGVGNTNTITFDPATFGTAQTITLSSAAGFGTLNLARDVVINGPGATLLAIDGGCTDCGAAGANTSATGVTILSVATAGLTASVRGLTLQHGRATASIPFFGGTGGGAISITSRGAAVTFTVTDCAITDNSAAYGGGLLLTASAVTVTGTTFSGNRAVNSGGAISVGQGAFNGGGGRGTSESVGGNPSLAVTNSTFGGNTAAAGGAIFNALQRTLTLQSVTVSGNTSTPPNPLPATTGTGAVANGIFGSSHTATLANSILVGNNGGSGDYYNVIVNANTTNDSGHNLIGTSGGYTFADPTDKVGVAPLLAPLAPYAPGMTATFALLPGSPAIDSGGSGCPGTGQRGVTRPQGVACAIGAFESRGFAAGTLTGNTQSAVVNTAFGSAVGLTVSDTNSEPVAGGQITYTITPGAGGASATFGTAPAGCTNTSATVSVCTLPISGVVTSPPFTANSTAGGFTIVATANGVPTTTFNETNTPGPAATFTVTGCPSPLLSGTPCTVTVTAKDVFGNKATGYTGTVAITSSDVRAILPASATLTNGVGSFTVTLRTPGTQSITATDTVTGTITGSQTGITVTGTAPAAVNDSYTLTTGTTLTVAAATGVLINDTTGNPIATITANTQPAHGSVTLNADGSFVYTPTTGYIGADSFTYTLTNAVSGSTGTVSLTVTVATVTGLTTTAPATSGGMTPTLLIGGKLTLATTATYNNGTTSPTSGLSYTSSNPTVASVDPAIGVVMANTAGSVTITVTGPNGSRTTLTLTVTGAAGTGLMPLPQPMAHGAAATVTAIPVTQPVAHPAGNGTGSNGVQPQAAGVPTAMPNVQPGRH